MLSLLESLIAFIGVKLVFALAAQSAERAVPTRSSGRNEMPGALLVLLHVLMFGSELDPH
jgi:hypothetical protein